MRATLLLGWIGLAGTACSGAQEGGRPGGAERYRKIVRRYADVMLSHGTDRWGARPSAMFVSVLDRDTLEPPAVMPPSPGGNRAEDRVVPFGSNLNLHQNFLKALVHLTRLGDDGRYERAATEALVDFIRLTQHPETGLLAWGEHLCWDLEGDRAATAAKATLIHEPKRKLAFFDELYEREPVRVLAFAKGLWEHQIADHETGDFSRHAGYDRHAPGRKTDFAKEGSYFIDCWSRAYEKTKDPLFDRAVKVLARRYLGRMTDRDLFSLDSSGKEGRADVAHVSDMLSLAVEAHDAAARMGVATAALLRGLAERIDRGVLALPHAPEDPARGFVAYAWASRGQPCAYAGRPPHSRRWGMGYGARTTGMIATLMHARHLQASGTVAGGRYRELVFQAARGYLREDPDPVGRDLWAGEFGVAIFACLAAYRLEPLPEFLQGSRRIADRAIDVLWDGPSGLPRASSGSSQYEDICGCDTLALGLLALYEHLAGLPPSIPIDTLIR